MPSEYQFTNDFQDQILACLVRHPDKFMDAQSVLKPKYFQGIYAAITARCSLEYFQKYTKFPSWETLGQLVSEEAQHTGDNRTAESKAATDYVGKLSQIATGDADYVRERIVAFARERATIAAIRDAIVKIQEGQTPDAEFVKMMEDALSVGRSLDDIGYVLHEDVDKVVDKITAYDYGVKTGYPALDQIWKMGWGPGWLIVPLAPPKRWKTCFAINLALNMVGPQYNESVFYYTCEISQELALARALCSLGGKSMDYLFSNPEKFKRKVREQIQIRVGGYLIVKGFPAKTATIADIKAHAKMVINSHGIKPKAIFIDYAETVRPSTHERTSEHQSSASIYTDARAMGSELGCAIIMPDRCNKETVGLKVPNMGSFQGAFQKAGIVDVAVGLCATDAEYAMNDIRYFVFLNRHGKAYQHFKGKVDPENFKMTVGEELPFDPSVFEEEAHPRRQRKSDVAAGLPPE